MKVRPLFAFTFLLTISFLASAQQKKAQPKNAAKPKAQAAAPVAKGTMFFDQTEYNFGTVDEERGRKYADFTFTNIGKGNVRIQEVITGCGCTSAEWDRTKVYKQGEKDHITVSYNPTNINGDFSRTITVVTDGDPSLTYLRINGSVYGPTRELEQTMPYELGSTRMSHNLISMPHAVMGHRDSVTMRIYNNTDKWMRVLGIHTPPYLVSKAYTPNMEPRSYCTIMFTFYPDSVKMYGPVEDKISIVTDEKAAPEKIIGFNANIQEDFSKLTPDERKKVPKIQFAETAKNLGEVYVGEVVNVDFEITNTGKSDLMLRRAYGMCGCTVASVSKEPVKKGKKGKVTVRFDAKNMFGDQTKYITVISNDPAQPVTVLTLKASLVYAGYKKY